MDKFAKMVDEYSANVENALVIGDFNMEVRENSLAYLILDYNLHSLQKDRTCFKSANG